VSGGHGFLPAWRCPGKRSDGRACTNRFFHATLAPGSSVVVYCRQCKGLTRFDVAPDAAPDPDGIIKQLGVTYYPNQAGGQLHHP
jgi:hypothetical protein